MTDLPPIAVRRIVGTGVTECLLTACIELPVPTAEVMESRKTVLVDKTDVTLGNVILQGRLHMLFLSVAAPRQGAVSAFTGPVMAVSADIGFSVHIPVKAASPGMTGVVRDGFVAASVTDPAQIDSRGRILALRDQSLVQLVVQVLAEAEVQGPAPRTSGARRNPPGGAPVPGPRPVISRFGLWR